VPCASDDRSPCRRCSLLELLAHLRASHFETFIVSGGGVEFMRPWVERVYGIPPEPVIGSRGKLELETRDGQPVLVKLPEIDLAKRRSRAPSREPEPRGLRRTRAVVGRAVSARLRSSAARSGSIPCSYSRRRHDGLDGEPS